MTREEAIKMFRKEIECLSHSRCEDCILEKACDPMKTPLDSEYIEAYEISIKALEQEPCEDAISREAAVNAIYDLCGENVSLKENPFRDNPNMDAVVDELENLPSVTPKCEVLDKIRAEIDSHCSDNRDRNDGLYIAMKIIDKYKAESEDKE